MQLEVTKIHWTDSPELPKDIRENCERRGRFGLIAEVRGFENRDDVRGFLAESDLRVFLKPKPQASKDGADPVRLGIGFDPQCYWLSQNVLKIYVPFGKGDIRDLVHGVDYVFHPRNSNSQCQWSVPNELTIRRDRE